MMTPSKPKVLIVDDSSETLQILMDILKRDYAVIVATNGKKALQLATKVPIPDLILLDVVMPEMDGYEVCRQLKANPNTDMIPVIFLTALEDGGDETRGFELGAIDYITKPVSHSVIKARLKSHLALIQLNEQLQQTNQALVEANRVKAQFLANISHELRTPLNAILGLSQSLQQEILGALTQRQRQLIQTIENSGQHLLELINDILEVSKISSGQVELNLNPTSISDLCQDSLSFVHELSRQKNIQLTSEIPPDLKEITVDQRRIRQALINLLSNAVKFTPEAGSVCLKAAVGQGKNWRGQATVSESLQSQNIPLVVFQVSDTGIGIAADKIPQLVEPFIQVDNSLTREYTGTGLGLTLVKQITQLHGGWLEVDSEPGVGSSFTIALPDQRSWSHSNISPLILLAEESEENWLMFGSYLEAHGYRLIIAHHGEEAIAMAQAELPDLILMELPMTKNRDGLTVMQQIRQIPKLTETPMIALTAFPTESERDQCLAAGANDYLSKPIRPRQLVEAIEKNTKDLFCQQV
jgi:signal transduction histidine kinase